MAKGNEEMETNAPTISDLTEETNGKTTDMDEDSDRLAPVLLGAIPSSIEKFIPNKQGNAKTKVW
jgi:hypothetical protein